MIWKGQVNHLSSNAGAPRTLEDSNWVKSSMAEFVAGTQFVHASLKKLFPFGYAVASKCNHLWSFQPAPDGSLRARIPFGKVKIDPDFNTREVAVTVPEVGCYHAAELTGEPNGGWRNTLGGWFRMQVGEIHKLSLLGRTNQPSMFFGTLSDNHLLPVFVIGFRGLGSQPAFESPPEARRFL